MTESTSTRNAATNAVDASTTDATASSAAQRLWRQAQRVLASNGPCPSPCVSVYRMSPERGLCEGCWRDLDELRAWGQASDGVKREVWQRIQTRLRSAYPQVCV